jgi:hypothetical protein
MRSREARVVLTGRLVDRRNRLALSLFLASACSSAGTDAQNADRRPLGKADAVGSCRVGDDDDACGGKSTGNCWCDDQCADFGDCCADKVAVCDGLDLAAPRIDSEATFDALAFTGQDGVVIGKSVKFLIDARQPSAPQIRFMNANFDGDLADPRAKELHYFFARAVFGVTESTNTFNDVTYWTQDKRYFAGTLQQYRTGADQAPLYAIQFYPQDVIAEDTVLRAARSVADAVDLGDARLAFVATGPQQTTATVTDELAGIGVESLGLDDVLGALDYIPMQTGEAWGFLRIFPQDQDQLSALDIPVFAELPLDLTVVAGSITVQVQDASSHINLKSKERGTPNMVLRSAGPEHPVLREFADQPVHLVVAADGFTIAPSTEDEVRRKLAEKLDKPWQELGFDANADTMSVDDLCPNAAGDCTRVAARFGGKVGGLGFLRHPDVLGTMHDAGSKSAELEYDIAPAAVGVPVRHYFEFVAHNPELQAALAAFIEAEKAGTLSVAERVGAIADIQQRFYAAQFPAGQIDEIVEVVQSTLPPGTLSVKVRSSANAEDIPGFDGAGLYDSFRADLDKVSTKPCALSVDEEDGELEMKPKTMECAIKGVYASLWNKRAVEERSFARIDHATAGMGLAIVRRYAENAEIAANSVVVTRVLNSSGVYGYTFSSQVGNNVVTNPKSGTLSETIIAAFLPGLDPTFSVTRFAKPTPEAAQLDRTVMTNEQLRTMLDITQTVELAYCREVDDYYPGGASACDEALFDVEKPRALDMELKLFIDGRFHCKQVREFSGK